MELSAAIVTSATERGDVRAVGAKGRSWEDAAIEIPLFGELVDL